MINNAPKLESQAANKVTQSFITDTLHDEINTEKYQKQIPNNSFK